MAFETMSTASLGTGYTPSEDAKRTGNIQYLYDRRVECIYSSPTTVTACATTACVAGFSYTVPAAFLGACQMLHGVSTVMGYGGAGGATLNLSIDYGDAGCKIAFQNDAITGAQTNLFVFDWWLKAAGGSGSQIAWSSTRFGQATGGGEVVQVYYRTMNIDSAASQNLVLRMNFTASAADVYAQHLGTEIYWLPK